MLLIVSGHDNERKKGGVSGVSLFISQAASCLGLDHRAVCTVLRQYRNTSKKKKKTWGACTKASNCRELMETEIGFVGHANDLLNRNRDPNLPDAIIRKHLKITGSQSDY